MLFWNMYISRRCRIEHLLLNIAYDNSNSIHKHTRNNII